MLAWPQASRSRFAGFEAYTAGTLLFLLLTLAVGGVIYLAQWAFGLRVRSSA